MTSFGYKQINTELVDYSDYTNVFTHIKEIPRKVLFLEKYFLPSFFTNRYKQGVYIIGKKRPILSNTIEYATKDGIVENIDCSKLDRLFSDIDTLYVNGSFQKALTKAEFETNRILFTDTCTYPVFTEDFLKFVVSDYMRNYNKEKALVDNDLFGMSHHIHLLDNEYKYMDLKDFFELHGIADNLYYKELLVNFEMLHKEIITLCDKFNPLSLKITVNNNHIKLMFYDSPSSRRYNINEVITSTDDISIYEEI